MPDLTRHLVLDNGLHLTLRHAPHLKRSAAALRVQAGSHDAPAAWPGLAHFLEHLLFLGTARFPLEDGLMRHVQRHGGQVNASTRERTTDFFFEVPPSALAGSLERLCQMLAEPDLGLTRQCREREVIHAEFIAWSRDAQAQQAFARLQRVSPRHPLSAFQAGNRYTLPILDPAFQQALHGFHQRFYQGAHITLSLCGPQPLETLQTLGNTFGRLLRPGTPALRQTPPPLLETPLLPRQDGTRLDLLFAHEALPEGAEAALEALLGWLTDNREGTWRGLLEQRGWVREVSTEVLHSHAGQALWSLHVQLDDPVHADEVQRLLQGWLGFLATHDLAPLHDEFGRMQQAQGERASALDLARRDSCGRPFQGLDAQARQALHTLLAQCPTAERGVWHLPPVDAWLDPALPALPPHPVPSQMVTCDALSASQGLAVLYLRWHFPRPLQTHEVTCLARRLSALQTRARRAALTLQGEDLGAQWQLHCTGRPAAVLHALPDVLAALQAPLDDDACDLSDLEPPLMPIRALLKQLPACLALDTAPEARADEQAGQPTLDRQWRQARWHGMALGFDPQALAVLGAVLQSLPGQAARPAPRPPLEAAHWHTVTTASREHALLLFCPVPAPREAEGRLLAHALQGPFYQRLRVELQLGYAVFSGFRTVEGRHGLLFGVQSPGTDPHRLLEHVREVLDAPVTLTPERQRALLDQLASSTLEDQETAAWYWQAHLAAQPDGLGDLRQRLGDVTQADLDRTLSSLRMPDEGWQCLANGPMPPGWLAQRSHFVH
ncbi:pyrroloquinoline quinone biosynthesis protein PqqF [Pseudomonas monteilii]